jgi:hypothetical protein
MDLEEEVGANVPTCCTVQASAAVLVVGCLQPVAASELPTDVYLALC